MFDSIDDGDEYLDRNLWDPNEETVPENAEINGRSKRMELTDLNPLILVAAAALSICTGGLIVVLLCAPRRDCFFLRWHPETRLLALIAAPSLLILWPIVLLGWLMRSGVIPDDPDFYDD